MGAEPALWRVPQRLEKASILRGPLGEVVGGIFLVTFLYPRAQVIAQTIKVFGPAMLL